MQQRVPHPCTRARVTKQPGSQGSLLREEKLIHPRNGGFIIPPSPDPNITPSPYQAIFSREEQMPSVVEEREERNISHSLYLPGRGKPGWLTKLVLQEVARLPSRALSAAGLSVLRLLRLQTLRQALFAGRELPRVGASVLIVKGRVRGHSKSFTNISQSFIIFALQTAAHKSTKVHEFCACPSASALSGAHLSVQGTKNTHALNARMNFRGRGMPGLEWGFGIPDCRSEVLKKFFVLIFPSCFKN